MRGALLLLVLAAVPVASGDPGCALESDDLAEAGGARVSRERFVCAFEDGASSGSYTLAVDLAEKEATPAARVEATLFYERRADFESADASVRAVGPAEPYAAVLSERSCPADARLAVDPGASVRDGALCALPPVAGAFADAVAALP